MIRVTFELVPHGLEQFAKIIGRLEIFNDATGTSTKGNYGYCIFGRRGQLLKKANDITNFPRKRLTVFDLVFRVLRHVYGHRNKLMKGVV